MRILFLSNAASIHTVRWVNALAERGHEVHLVYKFDDVPKDNTISEKVILHRLKYAGTKGYFLNSIQLKQLSNIIKPNIINAHYASGYGTLARLAKLTPLLLSVWGADVYDFPYLNRLNMRILVDNLNYAEKIASTSISMASQVRKLLNNDEIIEITPFGIDITKFKRTDQPNVNESVKIGIIKALAPKYGIDDFIESIKILIDNLVMKGEIEVANKISARIYGDGEQKGELQVLINKLGLTNVVTLEGKIPNIEVPSALNELDIFCVTSVLDSESFGVAVVEAMAMNLPVVATDVSGFKEVVLDGETGILVERKNPIKIAEALELLVMDREKRKEYGKKGRERVEQLYNWKDNVSTMEKIYENIISDINC